MTGDRHAPPACAVTLWRELVADPDAFEPGTRTFVTGSRGVCPPGWVGAIRLGDAVAVEVGAAPDDVVATLRACADPTDPVEVAQVLAPAEDLGPGVLAYLPEGVPPPAVAAPDLVTIAEEPVDDIRSWLATLPEEDVQESSVPDLHSTVVARVDGTPVAAAGHVDWPTDVAHVGVVVAPRWRGAGIGTSVAARAIRRAHEQGLAAQWRAAEWNAASRAVAHRLGFVEVGRQFSFRPT